jgi:thiol:disulfide interchange protein DsbD
VTAALALLMLLVGLNLSGVYHANVVGQDAGAGLTGRGGAAGAFFTGALAVLVAAPCTAPFMAGALGYAVVQPPLTAMAVFLALGLGLALPFTALSFAPGLLRRLPRPGPWMERLKRVLALPMYAAAAWLAWVFFRQAGGPALGVLAAAAVVLAAAAWLYGRAQRPEARGALKAGALGLGVAAAVAAWVGASGLATGVARPGAEPDGAAYSAERLAALRAEGRPVFVNFTADWCVTCKVNERMALSSGEVSRAFERTGVVYLKGDWTSRDPVIAEALAEHGRAGVPLYLLYAPGAAQPRILPQLLTKGAVIRALEEAART